MLVCFLQNNIIGDGKEAYIDFAANITTLNFSLSRAVARDMKPRDGIIITDLDYEANRGPRVHW